VTKQTEQQLTFLKLGSEDDGLAIGGLDAVQQHFVTEIRVYQSPHEAGLAQAQPDANVLDTIFHKNRHAVVLREWPGTEVTPHAITEFL